MVPSNNGKENTLKVSVTIFKYIGTGYQFSW